jgi:hypothetical protein
MLRQQRVYRFAGAAIVAQQNLGPEVPEKRSVLIQPALNL